MEQEDEGKEVVIVVVGQTGGTATREKGKGGTEGGG